jgi:hypothetical protein
LINPVIYSRISPKSIRQFIVAPIVLAFFLGQGFGVPTVKDLIDATPGEDVLISLDEWFATHSIRPGELGRSDGVFASPRSALFIGSNQGTKGLGRHMEVTADFVRVGGFPGVAF